MTDGYHYDKLCILNNVYRNTLHEKNMIVVPPTITTPLYPHQKVLAQGMCKFREKMTRGCMVDNQAINGKIGIVGDSAGTGKTLSVLTYLASQINAIPSRITFELVPQSTKYFFSHELRTLSETNWANLIIVPHSLFNQWKYELEHHTSLAYVPIESRRVMRGATIANSIIQHRIVLTTNKCYRYVQEYANEHHIQWDNIVIDEACSVYFNPSEPPLQFQFLWLISNQWIPLIMKIPRINKNTLYFLRDRVQLHPDLEQWLLDEITIPYEKQLVSSSFLKNYVSFYHPHRSLMILRNLNSFVQWSMNIPSPNYDILHCKPNITLNSLISYYLARQRELNIRAANIPHLFQALGIEFQTSHEYVEQQPDSKHALVKRMINDNECVICLEPCQYPTMVHCCYHIFCGSCLLKNTLISMKCPTCREVLQPKHMCCLSALSNEERMLAKNKFDMCVDLFRQNMTGKFIIYSPFVNTYYDLFDNTSAIGLRSERIENNLFSLIKTVRNFQKGITNILFISNIDAIRGINLTSATHLIFYHELPSYELKQALVHSCQRLGRTSPLQIVHLYSEIQV
jgi:hypothetical protein